MHDGSMKLIDKVNIKYSYGIMRKDEQPNRKTDKM